MSCLNLEMLGFPIIPIFRNPVFVYFQIVVPFRNLGMLVFLIILISRNPLFLCFQIITPFRNLVVGAESRKDMEEWITALRSATNNEFYDVSMSHYGLYD